MQLKHFFRVLFILTGALALWIGTNFSVKAYRYFRLSSSLPVTITDWKVEEPKPGKFAILAHYHFQVDSRPYSKEFLFSRPLYLNPYIAEDHISLWKNQEWKVWYHPHNPHMSSLQKPFPFKEGIHLLLCLGVIVYFLCLNIYVKRINQTDEPAL